MCLIINQTVPPKNAKTPKALVSQLKPVPLLDFGGTACSSCSGGVSCSFWSGGVGSSPWSGGVAWSSSPRGGLFSSLPLTTIVRSSSFALNVFEPSANFGSGLNWVWYSPGSLAAVYE